MGSHPSLSEWCCREDTHNWRCQFVIIIQWRDHCRGIQTLPWRFQHTRRQHHPRTTRPKHCRERNLQHCNPRFAWNTARQLHSHHLGFTHETQSEKLREQRLDCRWIRSKHLPQATSQYLQFHTTVASPYRLERTNQRMGWWHSI